MSDASVHDGGAGAIWARCAVTEDCILRPDSCCGACGVPSVDDFDGVHRDRAAAHEEAVCPTPEPCPGCPTAPNPDLYVVCETGLCTPLDLRRHEVSECVADDECVLRTHDCCECGADTELFNLIAFNPVHSSDVYPILCGDEPDACPECVPLYPTDVEAFCADDGHCDVRRVE